MILLSKKKMGVLIVSEIKAWTEDMESQSQTEAGELPEEVPGLIFRDIRRYYCDYCGICRSKKTLITSHILAHHKEEIDVQGDEEMPKSHICGECVATFKKPAHLKQHMQSHSIEVYPARNPDLSHSPIIISRRYNGDFPETIQAKGVLGDLMSFSVDLKTHIAKEMPLEKISARQQIYILTAQARFSENKQLEEKVAKMSVLTGYMSLYTRFVLHEAEKVKVTSGL